MGSAVKLKATQVEQDRKAFRDAQKAKNEGVEVAVLSFSGKVFADLTGPEKDDLLKLLAIRAGIIEE